ncbi:hypothetical protein quinque_009410 [Culex quinquefasciatus]
MRWSNAASHHQRAEEHRKDGSGGEKDDDDDGAKYGTSPDQRQTRVQRRLQQHQPVRRNVDGHDKPPQASEQREQAEVGDSDRVSRSSSIGSSS